MASLQKWSALWDAYPDYYNYPDSAEVKKMIGGAVNDAWITNTCAIRLSRALNYNGFPIPFNFAGLNTVRGNDRKRYAFRVRELRPWLQYVLGKPGFDHLKKAGTPFDKKTLADFKGIIGFDIHFSDATGHLDLWDGNVFSSEYHATPDYWVAASRISLWKAIPS